MNMSLVFAFSPWLKLRELISIMSRDLEVLEIILHLGCSINTYYLLHCITEDISVPLH